MNMRNAQTLRIVVPTLEQIAHLPAVERRAASVFPEVDLPLALRGDTVPRATLEQAFAAGLLRVATVASGELVKGGTGPEITVGFAVLERHEDAVHLIEASVLPELAGRGIGRRLVNVMIGIAREREAVSVTLTTFNHLPWNRPFYERCGFRVVLPEQLSQRLREALAAERAVGLTNRVAMICGLSGE